MHETPEFQQAVKNEASKLFADFRKELEDDAKKKEQEAALVAESAAKEQEWALQEAAQAEKAKAEEEVDMTKPLHGNQDTRKQYNIREINKLKKLPTDKVVIMLHTLYKTPSGRTEEDKALREVQFVNPDDFEARSKTNEDNGLSIYDVLGVNFTLLHKPE